MTPRKIGTYELLELLGEGGIGQVYAARDTVLGRQVAIKMLRAELSRDRNFITRFYNEAQSLGDLSHANITTLHALHLEGREPFMVMELVHGVTLETVLERVHRLPLRSSLAVVAQAVAGLAYAHRRGVIHRDIKPSNLMVTDAGLLKIMDFGIARIRGSQRLTRAGQMFGTLLYASPEQIRGHDVDERSDLYSLAVALYEMLTGSPPFVAENDHELMTAHLEAPPPPLSARVSGLDPRIEPAVMRALAKRPEERFSSVDEFGRAVGAAEVRGDASDILQDYLGSAFRRAPPQTRFLGAHSGADLSRHEADTSARGRDNAPRSRPTALRKRLQSPVALLGAIAVALALGLGYLVLWPKRLSPPGPQVATVEPSKATAQQHLLQQPSPPPLSPAPATQSEPAPTPLPAASSVVTDPPKFAPPAHSSSSGTTPVATNAAPVIFQPPMTRENAPILLPATQDLKQTAALPPATPQEPEPALALVKPPQRLRPDLQGTVSAIESTSRIRIGDRWIDLYGINDPTQRAHTQDMLAYLKPSRGVVECYQKTGGKFQCYADGKDLALLALRSGLAQLTPDAPTAYRTPATQAVPDRN
jgi:serine/threonine protein kinase